MKFGCYCRLDQIALLAPLGFDYVELSAVELLRLSEDEFAALKDTLTRLELPCLAVADYCGELPAVVGEKFDEKQAYAYAQKVCQRVYAIGARCIGVGAPMARMLPLHYSYYRAAEQAVSFFRAASDAASAYDGLQILVEALNLNSCNFCNTQQQACDLVTSINRENVHMEVDFFHMLMMDEPFDRFGEFVGQAGHIHISGRAEDDSRRFFAPEDEQLCKAALTALHGNGYEGTVSVEVPTKYLTKEAAASSLQMLRMTEQTLKK